MNLKEHPIVKYLEPTQIINGLETQCVDNYTLVFGTKHYTLTEQDINNIYDKVIAMLEKQNFWFYGENTQMVWSYPDNYIEKGMKIAYQIAFTEFITGEEQDWTLLSRLTFPTILSI